MPPKTSELKKTSPKPVQTPPTVDLSIYEGYQLGINLFDIDNINPHTRPHYLIDEQKNSRVDFSCAYRLEEDKPDERCLAFVCDLLTAALTLDMIRNEWRQSKEATPPIRAYIKRPNKDGWSRLKHNDILTTKNARTAIIELNSEIFRVEEEPYDLTAPPTAEVSL